MGGKDKGKDKGKGSKGKDKGKGGKGKDKSPLSPGSQAAAAGSEISESSHSPRGPPPPYELHPEIIAGYQAAGAMAQAPGSGDDRQQHWFEALSGRPSERCPRRRSRSRSRNSSD